MLRFRLTTECRSSRPTATIDLMERFESSEDLEENEEQQRDTARGKSAALLADPLALKRPPE